jgi:hypothetical protein
MVLSFGQFHQQLLGRRQEARNESNKVLQEIRELVTKQKLFIQDWTTKLDDFEGTANVEDLKVDSVVGRVEELSSEIFKLQRTEKVLQIAVQIESLKRDIVKFIEEDNFEKSIACLGELRNIPVDSSFKSLVDHHQNCKSWCQEVIDKALRRWLTNNLSNLGWPKPIDPSYWSTNEMESLLKCFDEYTRFAAICGDTDVLLRPVKVMVDPLRMRFHFHFTTDRPTNRFDKPEWFLSHILQIIEQQGPFIENVLELDRSGDLGVMETFVKCLSDLIVEHLVARQERIIADPFILLHTVSELFSFTTSVAERTGVDCSSILNVFLVDNLDVWIGAEARAAHESYVTLTEESLPWDEESLEGPNSVSHLVIGLIELVSDLVKTLFSISPVKAKLRYFDTVIVPVFNSFYARVEFELPAFHSTDEELQILLLQANSFSRLTHLLKVQWGESLGAISLAGNEEWQNVYGYDATGLPGTIFNKILTAFEGLAKRVEEHLFLFLWQSFATSASSFVRAMHYGVIRPTPTPLTMHDDLRKALVSVSDAFHFLKIHLNQHSMTLIEAQFVENLGNLLFDKLILQNFFRTEAVIQLSSDISHIKATFTRLMPQQPIDLALQKTLEAVKILSMPELSRQHLQESIQSDDLDEVGNILQALAISYLTLGDCEKIINLLRN